jgi:hypothetical protein
MSCSFEPASPQHLPVYRLARKPDVWTWPDWSYAGPDGIFDNRWDDPLGEYRVLYASSQRLGAFVETLARFRPDPHVIAGLAAIEGNEDGLPPGCVPENWLQERMIGEARLTGAFANVGHTRSLTYLRQTMAARLLHYGIPDLDAAAVRLRIPRKFTQEISRVIYECTNVDGGPEFNGVFYLSRLGDDLSNWAIFEPANPADSVMADSRSSPILREDPDFLGALRLLSLTLV